VVTLILPFTFIGRLFHFTPPALSFLLMMGAIVIAYILSAEILKRRFYGLGGIKARHEKAGTAKGCTDGWCPILGNPFSRRRV